MDHWLLADPLAFSEPVPWRGMPGLFNVDPATLSAAAREELEAWLRKRKGRDRDGT